MLFITANLEVYCPDPPAPLPKASPSMKSIEMVASGSRLVVGPSLPPYLPPLFHPGLEKEDRD